MVKLFHITYCIFLILILSYLANSQTVCASDHWASELNAKNHELSIVSQQDQIKIRLILRPFQPAILKVFLLNLNNIDVSRNKLQFSIGKLKLVLNVNSIQPEQKPKIFSYSFVPEELKKFIHQLTICNQAYVYYGKNQLRLSLKGSSHSVSAALDTISKKHIENLSPPFALPQFKIQPSPYTNSVQTINNDLDTKIKIHNGQKKNERNLFIIFLILSFTYGFFIVIPPIRRYERRKRAFRICINEISKQRQKLYIRREQLLYFDHYGTLKDDKWHKEIDSFITKQIKPILNKKHLSNHLLCFYGDLRKLINSVATNHKNSRIKISKLRQKSADFSSSMSGYDYESFCTKKLIDLGWSARTTQSSYDQGADVEAEKNGVKIVLQCKLYSKPVSNNAVQQINTAKTFYFADYAAVVSNSTYTKSARQLAHSTKVFLLHHEELEQFVKKIEDKTL